MKKVKATKKAPVKKTPVKKSAAKAAPKSKVSAAQDAAKKEKKILMVGDYLQEIFHLAGHSIEAGEEAQTPLIEIAMIALYLHNEEERDPGHKMHGVKLMCECKEKEHTMLLKEFQDECHD